MNKSLKCRVKKLESNTSPTQEVPLMLEKYNMKIRRLPPEKRGIKNPYYVLKEPDLISCRELGLRNIKRIKSVRDARKKGWEIKKTILSYV